MKHYDPNQPRDEEGQWAKVGGTIKKKVLANMEAERKAGGFSNWVKPTVKELRHEYESL